MFRFLAMCHHHNVLLDHAEIKLYKNNKNNISKFIIFNTNKRLMYTNLIYTRD